MRQTIYRDRQTGKFAKKSTWKRSKSHGGNRYKRERVKRKKRERGIEPPQPPQPPVPPEDEWEEWAITFKYPM